LTNFLSGSLTFNYTDVVADFYRKIYRITEDDEIKRLTEHATAMAKSLVTRTNECANWEKSRGRNEKLHRV